MTLGKASSGQLAVPGFELSLTGIAPVGSPSAEQWKEALGCVRQMETGVMWWIGDLLNYGETRYGETYKQAIEGTDYEYKTLADAKYVALSVPFSVRTENLSFMHHKQVASLRDSNGDHDVDAQREWLDRAESEGLSVAQLRAAIKSQSRKPKELPAPPTNGERTWKLILGDCLDELPKIEAGSVRLIFADPPYNIGIDYGGGAKKDRLKDDDYLDWVRQWMEECERLLTPDGSFWVMIGDEYADHFGVLLRKVGLHRRAWVKWYETFGVNCPNNFNRTSRHIFYCVKNPKRFVFNPDAVNRPSDRQLKWNDKRANPAGKIWDDVWQIPRLVGNAKERIDGFPTQLPLALTRAIVGCASDPGDTVVDPFAGSASLGVPCIHLERRFIGIEKSRTFQGLAVERLLNEEMEKRSELPGFTVG